MGDQPWWRVVTMPAKPHAMHEPMKAMKSMETPVPDVIFVNPNDYSILPQGEEKYAAWLATHFSDNPEISIQSVTPVTKFNDEYNFTDKRLPVWKVSYALHNNERYFVETSTGKLSVRVDDSEVTEGYTFAMFHKHHFMDWGGKMARDASTMFWAFVQVVMIVIGLALWWRARSK
jgi:hypothetical protein